MKAWMMALITLYLNVLFTVHIIGAKEGRKDQILERDILKSHIRNTVYLVPTSSMIIRHSRGKIITARMEAFLKDGNQLDLDTLHLFLKALNDLECDREMKARHKHYVLAVEFTNLIPTTTTFNMLLKGVRLSNPPLYRFIPYFMAEMERFNVSYDDCTFNEMITLCARFPTEANVLAARSWLEGYQGIRKSGEISNRLILNSYLNVLVMAQDWNEAYQFVKWLKQRFIWNERLQHTYNKMNQNKLSYQPFFGLCC